MHELTHGGQKKASGPLELQLQAYELPYVGAQKKPKFGPLQEEQAFLKLSFHAHGIGFTSSLVTYFAS